MIRYCRELAPPLVEPVTVSEAKLWARVEDDDTSQDSMIQMLVKSARERAEELTGRCFAGRSFELVMDAFPSDDEPIEIPYPPLVSVDTITYRDGDGADQVLSGGSPEDFLVDVRSFPGRLMPIYNSAWPATQGSIGSVRIAFTAGYAAPKNVPLTAREFIMAYVATRYDNREFLMASNVAEVPRDFAAGMLDNLRVRTGFV